MSQITVKPQSVGAQAATVVGRGRGENAAWDRLGELTQPVLAANGAHVMVYAYAT